MFHETEYPILYSVSDVTLEILKKPIVLFRPFLSGLGQLIFYRFMIKPFELLVADTMLDKKKCENGDPHRNDKSFAKPHSYCLIPSYGLRRLYTVIAHCAHGQTRTCGLRNIHSFWK